jgi:hypothetical protein
MIMVFSATYSNISAISWLSDLLVEETGENQQPATCHWQILLHNSFFQVNKRISFEGSFILWFILFNATFNNISVISWQSDLLVEENRSTRRKSPTCR